MVKKTKNKNHDRETSHPQRKKIKIKNKNKEVCNEFFKNKDTWLTNNPKYL